MHEKLNKKYYKIIHKQCQLKQFPKVINKKVKIKINKQVCQKTANVLKKLNK